MSMSIDNHTTFALVLPHKRSKFLNMRHCVNHLNFIGINLNSILVRNFEALQNHVELKTGCTIHHLDKLVYLVPIPTAVPDLPMSGRE